MCYTYSLIYKMNKRYLWQKISHIKQDFLQILSEKLHLDLVPGPLFVRSDERINDYLSGKEQPVTFIAKESGIQYEVVHSLAKKKRQMLYDGDYPIGEGIIIDMKAIRREETVSPIHSLFVDQWDWEMCISRDWRNIEFLKEIVQKIWYCIREVSLKHGLSYNNLPERIHFITSYELQDMYPHLTPKERETEICKQYLAVFLMCIGEIHDTRSPEYDSWRLNGDILVFNPILDSALELSSMGIRVDKEDLQHQLSGFQYKYTKYHRGILNDTLPLTIGGGIGQSRLCMFILQLTDIHQVH